MFDRRAPWGGASCHHHIMFLTAKIYIFQFPNFEPGPVFYLFFFEGKWDHSSNMHRCAFCTLLQYDKLCIKTMILQHCALEDILIYRLCQRTKQFVGS